MNAMEQKEIINILIILGDAKQSDSNLIKVVKEVCHMSPYISDFSILGYQARWTGNVYK